MENDRMTTVTTPRLSTRARPAAKRPARVNVAAPERLLSLCGGSALAAYGLKHATPGGLVLALAGAALAYRGLTGHCQVYGALGVTTAERQGPATSVPAGQGVKVERAVTVLRPAEDLYRAWRRFENLPHFMEHLEAVHTLDDRRSRWTARGPFGKRFTWDAEIVTDRPGEVIAWQSLPGADVDTAGSVHFEPAPGDRGTVVRVVLKYDPPTGRAGATLARLFQTAPEQQIREDLRRFKQLMEAGEIPTTVGQTSCRAQP